LLAPLFVLTTILLPFILLYYYLSDFQFASNTKSRVQHGVSKTAQFTLRIRHILNIVGLCGDHLSGNFLKPFDYWVGHLFGFFIRYGGIRHGSMVLGMMISRTEIGDELIRRFIRDGGKQICCLGAGFDTRAYRVPALLEKKGIVKYFEVDIAPTQQAKLQKLKHSKIDYSHVKHLAVDFSKETFIDCLLRNGWKRELPTLFFWEGVAIYLEESVVLETFRLFSQCGKGTLIFFDVGSDFFTEQGKKRCAPTPTKKFGNLLEKVGEPFKWGLIDLSQEGVAKFLEGYGLELVELIDERDFQEFAGTTSGRDIKIAQVISPGYLKTAHVIAQV